jgi:hypothetical protein
VARSDGECRTFGNYPGTFSANNGQLDPNISSQYDLPELLLNRDGPLPNDRPHNIKVTGSYTVPFKSGGLTFGVNFYWQSRGGSRDPVAEMCISAWMTVGALPSSIVRLPG